MSYEYDKSQYDAWKTTPPETKPFSEDEFDAMVFIHAWLSRHIATLPNCVEDAAQEFLNALEETIDNGTA